MNIFRLPVLAGAAGALGATYCPPYITVDGSYNARPSGQTSAVSAASSKENNTAKVGNDWKPAQRPELANDDFGQRQKNPRRQVSFVVQPTLLPLIFSLLNITSICLQIYGDEIRPVKLSDWGNPLE
ncbi:UNVERIFIED_CONTAM: hypothetical protein Sindi_0457800 [Sesamum indicum]